MQFSRERERERETELLFPKLKGTYIVNHQEEIDL